MQDNEMAINAAQFADIEGLFEDKGGSGGIYLSIFDYTICQRSKSFDTEEEAMSNLTALLVNDPAWTGPHKTTNPKTKQDRYSCSKRYDRMIGRIGDISRHTKEFDASKGGGKVTNWDIVILSGGERLTLQLTYIDHVLKRFLKVAPNINFRLPLFISAFKAMKNGEGKQAVSFKQYQGDIKDIAALKNVDNWDKVEEYWRPQVDANGEKIQGSPYTGADGSILPPPIEDEEDGSWDYKAQNKFLSNYFRTNIEPTIKALAAEYGIESHDTDTSGTGDMTHTGGPVEDTTPVTTKPFIVVASNLAEMASSVHINRIKQLSKALSMDVNAVVAKLVGAGLDELNGDAAKYVMYMLEQRAAKLGVAILETPKPTPPPPAPTPAPVSDDLWDDDDATPAPLAQKQVVADADGDITDW